jgi:hypothetical protein
VTGHLRSGKSPHEGHLSGKTRAGFGVWREPFTELRVLLLFNLRRDPFEKAQHNPNTYND